jgi:two-component system response regulator PilR (NtrC family)
MRILVVDDEADLADEVCLFLERRGHDAVYVTGVKAAIAMVRTRDFDAIVTDMRMPDGSGNDVLRAANNHNPNALKIVITGQASEMDLEEALAVGVKAICRKPIKLKCLLTALDPGLDADPVTMPHNVCLPAPPASAALPRVSLTPL